MDLPYRLSLGFYRVYDKLVLNIKHWTYVQKCIVSSHSVLNMQMKAYFIFICFCFLFVLFLFPLQGWSRVIVFCCIFEKNYTKNVLFAKSTNLFPCCSSVVWCDLFIGQTLMSAQILNIQQDVTKNVTTSLAVSAACVKTASLSMIKSTVWVRLLFSFPFCFAHSAK